MSANSAPLSNHTEKDQRTLELQRQAFARGVKYREAHTYQLTNQDINVASCKEYPDPPQPREMTVEGWNWCVIDKRLHFKTAAGHWCVDLTMTHKVRALHDLLERPHA